MHSQARVRVRAGEPDVFFSANIYPLRGLAVDWLLYFGRSARGEHAIGDLRAFADHTPRGDERAFANGCSAQHNSVTAYERFAFDAAIFHDGAVADGDLILHDRLSVLTHMKNAVVLNGGASADADWPIVAAQHRSEPNARFRANLDVADEHGRRRDKGTWVNFWPLSAILNDHAPPFANAPRMHRHQTPLRGVKATPRPKAGDPNYSDVNYRYAGQTGSIHEVVTMNGRELAKVGFPDRKIVYYFLDDLELDRSAKRGTFHDKEHTDLH